MPHHWDIARAAKAPGMKTTIQLDPTKVTVRIKNRLLRWLEKGEYVGGWSSKSRRLAESLAGAYNLPQALRTWEGVRLRSPSIDLRKEMIELVQADWTAALLENPSINRSQHWYRTRYENTMRELEHGKCYDLYIGMYDSEFTKQAFVLLDKYQRHEYSSNVKACIDALNGTELITVMTMEP